jgi:glutamine amidotransferase PdxT
VTERETVLEDRRLMAAIAAALLGQQGSPVWGRTAELLLLSSQETRSHFNRAKVELEDLLDEQVRRSER